MVFARLLRNLVRDPAVGSLVAPIVSDEARTFGLEPLIAEAKIYAPDGQNYIPVDADLPLNYAESSSGQMLQEGITEAGALATLHRARPPPTPPGASRWSPSTSSIPCSASSGSATWPGRSATCAAAASWPAARPGAPPSWARASSTTTGSRPCWPPPTRPPWSTTPPSPTRWPSIMEAAVTEMLGADPKDRFWYLTLYNETYPMPALPEGADGEAIRQGIIDGHLPLCSGPRASGRSDLRASLCFSGPMWSIAVGGAAHPGRALRRRRRHLGRHVVDEPAHRRPRGGALEPAAPRGRAPHRHRHRRPGRRARSRRRHHRLHARRARPGGALRRPALRARSGPTASGAPTPARRCGPTSRSTAPTSSSPCCSSSPGRDGSSPPSWPRPSPSSASTPTAARRSSSDTDVIRASPRMRPAPPAAPSGTPRTSVRRSACERERHVEEGAALPSRCCASATAVVRAASESSKHQAHRRARRPAPTVTDDATRARHSSARSPSDAASRLQAIGADPASIVNAAGSPPARRG